MAKPKVKMRQLVDWSAAIWGGVIAGAVFLLVNMILTWIYIGSPWVVTRLIASIVLGANAMTPPVTFQTGPFVLALVIHFVLAIGFAAVIATALHRWGLLVGIIGGAVFGLAFYLINFYTISYLFPWFFPMRSWIMALSHIAFGALAGGIYEGLEVEKFVPVKD